MSQEPAFAGDVTGYLIAAAVVVLVVIVAGIVWSRMRGGPIDQVRPAGQDGRSLAERLGRTRAALGSRLHGLLGSGRLDDTFWEGLEEALIAADVGVTAATEIVERVRQDKPEDAAAAKAAIREELVAEFGDRPRSLRLTGDPAVIVVVGVNGTGKTTSIAKIAAYLSAEGRRPLLGAADTFRAAADVQLRTWADRVGVQVVSGLTGADPASVAFDAYEAARARGRDVVIVDTAGRLHSKQNLMDELGKVVRVLRKAAGEIGEVLLVLDATTGQNGLTQARVFTEAVGVTGIVLTKLDGTARGGVAVAVERELDIPVKFIGVGEAVGDMIPFVPSDFVDALLEDV